MRAARKGEAFKDVWQGNESLTENHDRLALERTLVEAERPNLNAGLSQRCQTQETTISEKRMEDPYHVPKAQKLLEEMNLSNKTDLCMMLVAATTQYGEDAKAVAQMLGEELGLHPTTIQVQFSALKQALSDKD